MELAQDFPGLKLEGGPFVPSKHVQWAINGVRLAQGAVGIFFFFGDQILGKFGQQPFEFMEDMPQRIMYHGGALYGLNCIASMLKSINAFEITYNGEVLFSKVASGRFPNPGEVAAKLRQIKHRSAKRQGGA